MATPSERAMARWAGWDAHKQNKWLNANPYEFGTEEYFSWNEGWNTRYTHKWGASRGAPPNEQEGEQK